MSETTENRKGSGRETPEATPPDRLTLRGFWNQLPTTGRWLLSTTAISTIGRGMTLPFTIIYVHEVRGVPLDVAGLLMGLIAVVALAVTGPVGALIDRLGARAVVIWGTIAQFFGAVIGVIIAGLAGVAVLALALERQISPRVNGILDDP